MIYCTYNFNDRGSVKSNVGHLEGASGIAGVIKAILALEAGVIPPNANFQGMNPNIDADSLHITIAKDVIPWPIKGLRRASVQSFGFGGANSHVILDDSNGFLHAHGLSASHTMAAPVEYGETSKFQDGTVPKLSQRHCRLSFSYGLPRTKAALLA